MDLAAIALCSLPDTRLASRKKKTADTGTGTRTDISRRKRWSHEHERVLFRFYSGTWEFPDTQIGLSIHTGSNLMEHGSQLETEVNNMFDPVHDLSFRQQGAERGHEDRYRVTNKMLATCCRSNKSASVRD